MGWVVWGALFPLPPAPPEPQQNTSTCSESEDSLAGSQLPFIHADTCTQTSGHHHTFRSGIMRVGGSAQDSVYFLGEGEECPINISESRFATPPSKTG